ncbi:MAG: hypothetical protein QOH80_1865 [Actinomycetota bacterium]|jgi:hypothetical protein|nr:hypothetical protein [Actinomycetota bacterium]
MAIERALGRFETVMGTAWLGQFAALQPGLDDSGIDRLRAAIDPFVLPHQVEELYRWRGGGDAGVFGGWRMRSLEELIPWYEFTNTELGEPPIWLPVFDDQIVNVVTLDHPSGSPSDPSVWYCHTDDGMLNRLFDSIEALLDVVSEAAETGALSAGWGGRLVLTETEESLDGRGWSALRLRRCPSAFRWPDPPPGTYLSRTPTSDWPRPWRSAVGVTDESLTLRGTTHTIAELIAAAASGQVAGTIRGRVVTGSSVADWWNPVVSDGSAELVVQCDRRLIPITPAMGQEAEFDVVLESPEVPVPITDDDPILVAMANRFRPLLPTAVAHAARLV